MELIRISHFFSSLLSLPVISGRIDLFARARRGKILWLEDRQAGQKSRTNLARREGGFESERGE